MGKADRVRAIEGEGTVADQHASLDLEGEEQVTRRELRDGHRTQTSHGVLSNRRHQTSILDHGPEEGHGSLRRNDGRRLHQDTAEKVEGLVDLFTYRGSGDEKVVWKSSADAGEHIAGLDECLIDLTTLEQSHRIHSRRLNHVRRCLTICGAQQPPVGPGRRHIALPNIQRQHRHGGFLAQLTFCRQVAVRLKSGRKVASIGRRNADLCHRLSENILMQLILGFFEGLGVLIRLKIVADKGVLDNA